MRCKPHCRHIEGIAWPKCPSSTRDVTESTATIRWSNAVSMVWSRTSSGVRITGTLPWFVLPFGRPGRRVVPDPAGFRQPLGLAGSLLRRCARPVRWPAKRNAVAATTTRQGERPPVPACRRDSQKLIQPMGVFARFGGHDDHHYQVDVSGRGEARKKTRKTGW